MAIKIRQCSLANKEHKASKRQYAHTGHYIDTICIAKAFLGLPNKIQKGIIMYHEVGHLCGSSDEHEADLVGSIISGHKIKRINSKKWGNNLETI